MATLREYFDTESTKVLSAHKDWQVSNRDGSTMPPIIARICQDFNANAKYWSFYLPPGGDAQRYVLAILQAKEVKDCILGPEGDTIEVKFGFHGYSDMASSKTLVFTNRIHLYLDYDTSDADRNAIVTSGESVGYHILVKDQNYAKAKSNLEKPLAFISHDSRDKDAIVRNLAIELYKLMCPVWYDEFSLRVGDSLRQSIEKGLKETKKCIVVLSPNFLSNDGWGKAEFDSVFTREILQKENMILPIWHNVNVGQVYEYSPRLADKVGLSSTLGIEDLARRLANVIKFGGNISN